MRAPNVIVFVISLILFVIAWVGYLAAIPYISNHPSYLVTLAYIVLALGCLL
jgi:hypothetical protein